MCLSPSSLSPPALRVSGAGATAIFGAILGGAMSDAEFSAHFSCCCPRLPSLSPTRSRTLSPAEPPPLPRPFMFCFVTFPLLLSCSSPLCSLYACSAVHLYLLRLFVPLGLVQLPFLVLFGGVLLRVRSSWSFVHAAVHPCPLCPSLVLGSCLLPITHADPSSSFFWFF